MVWVLWQPAAMVRDDALPALAVVLSALGLAMVARLSPALAARQQLWIFVSLALAIAVAPLFAQFRRFAAYKYLWVVASLALFALLLVFGQEINGARLWIRLGPIQYEPIELIKLFIVLFLAAYLAETADVIANARPWSLRANLKYLGPLFVGWGASMAILVVQRDLGMATLLLGDVRDAALRRNAAARHRCFRCAALRARCRMGRPSLSLRADAHRRLAQSVLRSVWRRLSIVAGILFACRGRSCRHRIPARPSRSHSRRLDGLRVCSVFGGVWINRRGGHTCAIFLDLVRRIFVTGLEQPDLYSKLLAAGLGATLGFQVVIIISGVIGLLPLTGITLPFISYGGSSLVANFLLVALAWAMSARPRKKLT